jgi:hypothetical protein
VAAVIVKAATTRRPKDRYKVGPVAHLLPALRRWLPLSLWDRLQAHQSGVHLLAKVPTRPPARPCLTARARRARAATAPSLPLD